MKRSQQIILIILVGLLFYFNSLFNGLVWDDEFLIKDNPYIRSIPTAFSYAFSNDLFPGELLFKRTNYYRPLQTLSYSLDFFIWKDTPFGFHLANLILHIINALLIYLIISCLYNLPLVSFVCALFFVAHPIHHEAVSYISGRADLLAAFFILSSFYCFLKYRLENIAVRRNYFLVLSFICFFLALLSKEYALILPFLFLSFDFSFQKLNRKNLGQYVFFLPLIFLFIMLRLSALGLDNSLLGGRYAHLLWQELPIRFFGFIKSIPLYLGILIFPVDLHMRRAFPRPAGLFDPLVWIGIFILLSCYFIFYKRRKQEPLYLFLFLWFLIPVVSQSQLTLSGFGFAEHFLYLASMGVFFAFAKVFVGLFLKFKARAQKQRFIVTILLILLSFYGSLTSVHNLNWKDSLTFYKWTLKFSPESIKLRINLAREYIALGRDDLALVEFLRAKKLLEQVEVSKYKDKPILDWTLNEAIVVGYYNVAVLHASQKDYTRAEQEYRLSLAIKPNFNKARNNLAALLTKLGRDKEAIEQLSLVLSSDPEDLKAYYNLGAILANLGEDEKARQVWQDGLKIDPDDAKIGDALARLLEEKKR
ncbi:MAG: tetratricopeptide repeat protein [Candidatus Omnitrophica bacterium]|nr:tetratricopeptide repeat protein [Candidatus Omnitrophota bacterium]